MSQQGRGHSRGNRRRHRLGQRGRQQRGQAAIEAAIVMPLFIFLILGIIQLSLMHQTRSLVKYAAFKAARAGALHNGDKEAMEMAALAALMPVISQRAGDKAETVWATNTAANYAKKMQQQHFRDNKMPGAGDLKYVEIDICAPTRATASQGASGQYVAFDRPMEAGVGWREFESGKLAIQVTLNYRLFIPFADMVIYIISRGQEQINKGRQTLFQQVLRSDTDQLRLEQRGPRNDNSETQRKHLADTSKQYIVPIRASYALRIQSDLVLDKLPTSNNCEKM